MNSKAMQARIRMEPIRQYLSETLPNIAPWNDDLKTVAGMNLESIGKCLDDIMPYFNSWINNLEIMEGVSMRSIGRSLEIILPYLVSWMDKLERYEGIPLMSISSCLSVLLPYFASELDELELIKVLTTLACAVVCTVAIIGCVKLGIEALGSRSESVTPRTIAAWVLTTFYGDTAGSAPSNRGKIAVASGIGSALCLLASIQRTSTTHATNSAKRIESGRSNAVSTTSTTSALRPFHGGAGSPFCVFNNVQRFGEMSGLDPEICSRIAVASEIGFALGTLVSKLISSDDDNSDSD